MNCIILDLEWDSVYFKPEKRFINQILQIGAVKLDDRFDPVDSFEITVHSSLSNRVTGRFSNLTGITSEMMRAGLPLTEAVTAYNEWAGTDTVTMTWSDSDLYTIRENEEKLLPDGPKFAINKFLDLQRFVQGEMRQLGYTDTNQVSLAGAAEFFNIATADLPLHTAKADSLLCAALLKRCYDPERFTALIRDTADPLFYKRLRFKPYPISNLNDPAVDPKQLEFFCDVCGAKAKRLNKWRYRNRWFSARFACTNCDRRFFGRVSFKKTFDDVQVRRRICEIKPKGTTPQDEVQSVPETV